MLGGLIHGLRIPVSGLVVGSCAVICIALIAWYHPGKGAILKATIIVAIFKFILSPQAGPPAYIAVFFQGLMGEFLFRGRKHFFVSAMSFSILALMESGLQRILVLTIIYGNDLWSAINDLLNRVTGRSGSMNYSFWIVGIYLGVHFLTGVFIGWFAGRLPGFLQRHQADPRFELNRLKARDDLQPGKKRRKNLLIVIFWISLLLLFIQSQFGIGDPILPSHQALQIMMRSLLISLGWLIFIGPLLRMILQKWLRRKRTELQREVGAIENTLPEIRDIFISSWKKYGGRRFLPSFPLFIKTVLINVIRTGPKLLIISGPVHSGKTSFLQAWIKDHKASGILTPKQDGNRVFQDIGSGNAFPMGVANDQEPYWEIGPYRFSILAFQVAEKSIVEGFDKEGWLVIDEVGPLELKGKGFATVLQQALQLSSKNILIVVREGLVEEVVKRFGITDYELINPSSIRQPIQPSQKH